MRSIPLLAATTVILLGATACGDNGGGIEPGNDPVANFTFSACTAGTPCTFTDASSDPQGANTITGRRWNFGDGTPEVNDPALTQSHTFVAAGTFQVTLTVTDNTNRTNAKTNPVTVTGGTPNTPPTAAFTGGPCTVGAACAFTDASIDPDGQITAWSWTFGDPEAGTANVQHPTYTFLSAGTWNVTLTVTDNGGATHAVTVPVTVSPPTAAQCSTAGTVATCTLDITQRSTVDVTLTSRDCEIGGNRVSVALPRRQTLWFNVCSKPAGSVEPVLDVNGARHVFEAGTQLTIEFTQGTGIDPDDPTPTFPEMKAEGAFPTWTLRIDDGGAPQLPRNDDVVLTVTAVP